MRGKTKGAGCFGSNKLSEILKYLNGDDTVIFSLYWAKLKGIPYTPVTNLRKKPKQQRVKYVITKEPVITEQPEEKNEEPQSTAPISF